MIYAAAGSPEGDDIENVDLDWKQGGNLNRCREPEDVDAAFDRGEKHVGVALIALVYNNPDTDAVLPRVARGLRSPSPETRRQSLLALMHTGRLHGRVDADTLELLHGLLSDRTPISAGSPYEVRGTAIQTVEDLQVFLPPEQLPAWVINPKTAEVLERPEPEAPAHFDGHADRLSAGRGHAAGLALARGPGRSHQRAGPLRR